MYIFIMYSTADEHLDYVYFLDVVNITVLTMNEKIAL